MTFARTMQIHRRGVFALFDEQIEEVGLGVHDAHRAGVGQVAGGLGAVMQSLDPAKRLLLLASPGAGGIGGRRKVGAQHPERRSVGIERQGHVQLQAAGHGAGLVRADRGQPPGHFRK